MKRTTCYAICIVVAVLGCPLTAQAQSIYWTDLTDASSQQATIKRMTSSGSPVDTIVGGLGHIRGIEVAFSVGKVYWASGFSGTLFVQRANLDGSGSETIVSDGNQNGAVDVAVDAVGGKVYWTGESSIWWANLDGTIPQDIGPVDSINPVAIALDRDNNKIYWTDLVGPGLATIRRADLNGSNPVTIVTGLTEPLGLAVDPEGAKIYWTEASTQRIQRANLDGSGVEDLVVGLDTPTSIDLDLSEGKMYWTDSASTGQVNRIQKANLDGSNPEVVISNVGFPWGISVLPTSSIPTVSSWGILILLILLVTASTVVIGHQRHVTSSRCR